MRILMPPFPGNLRLRTSRSLTVMQERAALPACTSANRYRDPRSSRAMAACWRAVMSAIVITGARGYIGSALAGKLTCDGQALRLVSRSTAAPRLETMRAANVKHCAADLRKPQDWSRLLDGASAVIHLSSRTDLRAAEADPVGDHVLNVEPVYALVRAAEDCRTTVSVIFASSTSIVGNAHANPVDENTPDRPCSVYDRHKLECEMILEEATRRGVLKACALRLPTVYGYSVGVASSNPNRGILNTMIRRAASGQALTVYGEGKYIRDYIFIQDVVDAFCRALSSDPVRNGKHYVIASGCGCTLAESFRYVAREAYRLTGHAIEVRHVPEPPDLHPIERSDFIGDASLFRKLTGWTPRFDLQSGIRHYFEQLVHEPAAVRGEDCPRQRP